MKSLIDSVGEGFDIISDYSSSSLDKRNFKRGTSLIDGPSLQLNPIFRDKNSSKRGKIESDDSTNCYIDLIHEIISCYGIRIVHDNLNQNGVLFKENKFVLDSLHWHNILRIKHRAPPLSLSIQLCEQAQDWANKLAHWDVFYHQNNSAIGENLILKCSSLHDIEVNGEQVTKYWYAEIDHYRFDLPDSLLHTRANQFTQMIWRDSRKFGIGKARSRSGKLIIVAHYEPPGNISGNFQSNVLAPFKDFELDFIADSLIANHRGRLNRAFGRKLRVRRKAIYE